MMDTIFNSPQLRIELDYFKRRNEHFTLQAGKSSDRVGNQPDQILYMAMAASLAMDYSEDGFFEDFHITDKSISGKPELLIDAYALIETERTNEKHLHLFQFKLHESPNNAVSPKELGQFATLMNNVFVHPVLMGEDDLKNKVLKEIYDQVQDFLAGKRGRRVMIHCHFINNAQGIVPANKADIETVMNRFLTDKQFHNFNVQVYGLKDILDLAVNGKISVEKEFIEFEIDGPQAYRFEDNSVKSGVGLPKKVFVGICNVNEFITLQNKYHHNQLYAENIRLYLGDRAAVNKDIIHTICSPESIWFPYMNNGISIICDEFTLGNLRKDKKLPIELKNMQIINGCQTVNALYNAKYGLPTQANFRASNILVKIYEISPDQADFKMSVIRATNNQNAVKTYSLLSNDPIQIAIGERISRFGYIYDRKGEAKNSKSEKIVGMPNAALAYRAVFWLAAQGLRSKMGHSRVFQKTEYEKLYRNDEVDDPAYLNTLSSELLLASILVDRIRQLIQEKSDEYLSELPIFKKSTYYLSGYAYALYKLHFDGFSTEMERLLEEDNRLKISGKNIPRKIEEFLETHFDEMVKKFTWFYKGLALDKTDLDNLLKSSDFSSQYHKEIEKETGLRVEDIALRR
ncbi:MAG: AIPR family protein [Haliscomenobacter sp.]